ncbi:4'-phosphopantetheinyl transferase family protein [Streptomyces sp. NRRL F-5727]|uniref:4'-phosphopantetheinyl transferase family protein n=1 Tax=Streptomyces sp. NRRL F-5727 TaxID=1463871 RepID=UPI000B2E9F14|nr:4'-phosphopantetheinyl transferase superfamily protein [Streptomyces sp. NRRL F-5727]
MIQELFPAPVAAFDGVRLPEEIRLLPGEEAAAAGMSAVRRARFAAVRDCARRGMRRLGEPPAAVPRGPRGAPLWPAGLTGSMTHTRGYHAAAVARSGEVLSLGVDAEPDEPLRHPGMLPRVSLAAERAWVARLAAERPGVSWDRLLFSAKECVYKACSPVFGELGFADALITVDAAAGTFRARVAAPGRGRRCPVVSGRWLARDGLLVTALVLWRPARGPTRPEGPAGCPPAAPAGPGSGPPGPPCAGAPCGCCPG